MGRFLPRTGLLQARVHLIEPYFPCPEAIIGATSHFGHVRVLQMGVRVDETGSDQTVPMVLGDFPVDGHIVP